MFIFLANILLSQFFQLKMFGKKRQKGGGSDMCIPPRLKRENCVRTKHNSDFSKWKTLVGPSDWEDCANGKEGATKYRIHNLPTSSGPGIYELSVAILPPDAPRLHGEVSNHDSSRKVVVYIGHAKNVRKRLQGYGRSGNHLKKSYSSDYNNEADKDVLSQKGSALFREIFSIGGSILFRYALMESKIDAQKTETDLLGTCDYPWNKTQNGSSRPKDVLQKLDEFKSNSNWFANITRKIRNFCQKPVGIKIEAGEPPLRENETSFFQVDESKKLFQQILGNMTSRPRLVSVKCSPSDDLDDDSKSKFQSGTCNLSPICGMTLSDGTCCEKLAVLGRVRCEEHKGMKTKRSPQVKSCHVNDTRVVDSSALDEMPICGVEFGNGKQCRNQPVVRRKRCPKRKGLRVKSLLPKALPVQYTLSVASEA